MAKKVLIVDDSAAIRKSISYILGQAGYEVNEAEDGVGGEKRVKESEYDLVITDVNMPNMDGIELVRRIRGHEPSKFTPVIVLTTESQDTKMSEGKEAGATGWIVKPFDAEKLLKVVRKLAG
ncbi:MAG: response regulator [Spirochaetales bacterium]